MTLLSNSNVPFFFDNTLTKNFKVFGQVLYIYFDPTFRRYVSVIDVGLKQKATIFVDEVFKYRKNVLDNNFQFSFSKKKDIFFLKPVHFLNSKNERVLKKRYLSSRERNFSFLKLKKFSLLTVKIFTVKGENFFNFKNEISLNLVLLKALHFNRLLKFYKSYALIFLSFLKNSRKSKHRIYKVLYFFILSKSVINVLADIYKSLLYLFYLRGNFNLSLFFSWFDSFKNGILNSFVFNSSDLKLKKLFLREANNFFNFKSEKNILNFFNFSKKPPVGLKTKKLKKFRIFKNPKYLYRTNNRMYLSGMGENSNLFSLAKLSFSKLNKLEFSFGGFKKFNAMKFSFLTPLFNNKVAALSRKLRTTNYFSVISKGRAYALVNRFSFFNTFVYGGFLRRRIFKSWVKFLIYFEKVNYLIALNNEEVSSDFRQSSYFFYSVYFPLIFNFRNLFFNLLKFFKRLKSVNEQAAYKSLGLWFPKNKEFNKKFFGILLNFLLLNNKKFSRIPKNFLLNSSSLFYKVNFKKLNTSKFNNLSLIKYTFLGFIKLFLENINYLFVSLKFREKFVNDSLVKLSFTNFSLNFNTLTFNENQINLSLNFENSKTYLNTVWKPVFKIFKSVKIISRYARKYRKKVNFSKRRKFRPAFKKRGYFLAPLGSGFRSQKLFFYPFKGRVFNTQKWSYSIKKARVSPSMSRFGAYLDRLNALSKKFRTKVRIFPLRVFKNRLSMNFDRSKSNSTNNIYFQRLLVNSLSRRSRIRRSLKLIKTDRFIRRWDRNQFYANPVKKNFRQNFSKNMLGSNIRRAKTYPFARKSIFSRENRFASKRVGFSSPKKPIYRSRFFPKKRDL